MKTKVINLYTFEECSEELKEKILQNYWDINVDHGWWKWTYEDAQRIGIEITGFDIDRGNYCSGDFLVSAEEVANNILKEHGENCETYKTAKQFLIGYLAAKSSFELLTKYDLIEDFRKSIFEDYRIILSHEYDYLTSKESIIETLVANEYTFNEEGKIDF